MYTLNLTHKVNIRLTESCYNFLLELADINGISVSEVVRRLLVMNQLGMEAEFHGDTETTIND